MVAYRVRQFIRAVAGPGVAPDLAEFSALLTAQQKALFSSMAVVDQYHCLAVARSLARQGFSDPDLLRAALVHDAGKSTAHIAVWERVAHVLLMRFAPALVGRLGSSLPGRPGHGLYILAHHMRLGADLAAQVGMPAATVALVLGEGEPALQDALHREDDRH